MNKIFIYIICVFLSNQLFSSEKAEVFYDISNSLYAEEMPFHIGKIQTDFLYKRIYFFRKGAIHQEFKIQSKNEFFLQINNKLVRKFDQGVSYINSRELLQYGIFNDSELVFISKQPFEKFHFKKKMVEGTKIQVSKRHILSRKVKNAKRDFMLIGIVIITIFLGITMLIHPQRFNYIINKAFSLNSNIIKSMNFGFYFTPNIWVTFVLSLLISFLFIIITMNNLSNSLYFSYWVGAILVCFGVFIFKNYWNYFLSRVFDFDKYENMQLFEYINIGLFLYLILFFVVILSLVFNIKLLDFFFINLNFLFLFHAFFFTFWFFFKVLKRFNKNKLMIIIYLCASEIAPALILESFVG